MSIKILFFLFYYCESNSIQNYTKNYIQYFKLMAQKYQGQEVRKSLQVQCREGPIAQRSCTDVVCCILYILLIGSILFLAFFASTAAKKTQADVQNELRQVSGAQPLLAISQATLYILLSLAFVVAISILLVIVTFIIPSVAAYILIPLLLFLMLLLGLVFLYRYFGRQLPLISPDIQSQYAEQHSVVSLIVGTAFLAGFIVSIIVLFLKQQRIKYIPPVLRLAKICFWDNVYMFLVSIVLSAVSISALYLNLRILQIAQLQADGQQIINSTVFSLLILLQMIWTHGYLQAYSDFLFQSIAIQWYFNQKKYPNGYSQIAKNLCPSVGLSFRHIGTISFGWILAYIPQSLNILVHQCEQKAESCYNLCCVCHKCAIQHLSKYCYIATIMYSQSFCKSSHHVKDIRSTAKHTFPQLYMIGNFYITLVKIFIVLTSIIICYFLIAQESYQNYSNILNLLAPLIVTLLASLQIANHFMDSTGLVGDTIYLTYVIDYNSESSNFGNLNAQHCPQKAYEVIRQAKINKYTVNE